MTPVEVRVDLPGRPYSVWVGANLLARAHELIPVPDGAEVVAVVTDANVRAVHGDRAADAFARLGLSGLELVLEPGEETKGVAALEATLRWLAANGVHRRDLLVALGGGVVGDLGGFAAAVYHRGIAFAQVPTTLIGQVDAAIGGKTAVNLPEGKNLAGAFHQPVAVVADVDTLATLPAEELTNGMAEVAKHGLIDDVELLAALERDAPRLAARDSAALTEVVARAAAVKARVVARDETEQGARAHLNYGHTLAHALESLGGYRRWRHGYAVAVGMVFAAHLAAALGYADRTAEHRRVLEALGLPVSGAGEPFEAVAQAWSRDKKYRKGMRFVVLEDLGRPALVGDVPEQALRRAYEAVR